MKTTRLALALAALSLSLAPALAQDGKTGEAPPPANKTGETPPPAKTGETPPPAKKTGETPPPAKKTDETPPAKKTDAPPAPDEPVTITLEAVKAKVPVGEDIALKVTVKNVSAEPVPVRPIALSRFSLALELSGPRWKRPHMLFRIPGGVEAPKIAEQSPLKPGESISKTLEVPTVQVGKLAFKAWFIGHIAPRKRGEPAPTVKPKVLYSNKVDVEVAPNAEGGTVSIARIETPKGRIDFKFYDAYAPNTVRNFISLARAKKYDGTIFHRVIKGFMIQGGDPKGDGTGGPGYSIPPEFTRALHHKPGAVAMARTRNPASAGCQFYICLGSPSHLDGTYAIFGQVIEGMDVVKKIGEVPTGAQDRPTEDQPMTKVTIQVVKSLPK